MSNEDDRRTVSSPSIRTFTGGLFAQNTFLAACADGRTAVLVDPGAATQQALAVAERRGLKIAAILLTHAHFDHIEGVALARRRTGAPICLHPLDRPIYDDAAERGVSFGVPFEPPPPPDKELVPGSTLHFGGSGFQVVFVPGHAPGHVMFVSAEEPFAFVGDVVFLGSVGRTDLPGGDYRVLMDSIRSKVATLPDDTRLYPGHGPATTVAHELRTNPFLVPFRAGRLV